MRAMEKKAGLIFGGILLFSLVLVVGLVMAATSATTPATATVTVNTFLSVTLDDSTLAFPNLDPTQTDKPTADPLTATIGSESNVNAVVNTSADTTDFECISGGCTQGTDKIPISNLKWSATANFLVANDYTTTDATVCANVAPGDPCSIYHELTIPSGQAAGSYSLGITISVAAV